MSNFGPSTTVSNNTTPLLVAPNFSLPNFATFPTVATDANGNTVGIVGTGGAMPFRGPGSSVGTPGAIIGDSIAAFCSSSVSATNLYSDIRSWVHWGCAFHGGAITVEPINNFGLGGSTSAYALGQVPNAIASGAKVCFIQTGINDPTGGGVSANILTLAQSLSNMQQIVNQLKAAAIVPIIRLNSPNGSAGWTAAYRQQSIAFNEELKAYYGNPGSGVFLHDPFPLYVDTTNATSNPRAALVSATDFLHPVGVGASTEGVALANVLVAAGFPIRRIAAWGQAEAFDSTTGNIRGNLLNNNGGSGVAISYGALTGTAGTFGGTAVASPYAGTCATGFDITYLSGATVGLTGSTEATSINVNGIATGATYNRQVIANTFTGGENVRMRTLFNPASAPNRLLQVGDVVYGEVEVEVLAANANGGVCSIALIGNMGGATNATTALSNQLAYTALLPISNQGKFVLRTPLSTLITGVVGYIFDVQFQAAAGTTGLVTVKVGQPRLIKKSAFVLTT